MKRNDVTFSSTITSDKLFNGNLLSFFLKISLKKKEQECAREVMVAPRQTLRWNVSTF